MSARSRRRPSAAMVVACIALVMAMTGSATAISLAQIDGSSIKKNSIPGDRLVNHTLTGQQINMAQLGTVPQAATAANAIKLGGKTAASYFPAAKVLRWNFKMNEGQPAHRFTWGPLTFIASCANDSGNTRGELTVKTTESGTYVSNNTEDEPGLGTIINPGSSPYVLTEADSMTSEDGNSGELAAFDPQGKLAVFTTAQTFGVAINTPGANCRFFGYLLNDA